MNDDLHAARSARAAAMGAARAAEAAPALAQSTAKAFSTAAEAPSWPSAAPRRAWAARLLDPPRWALSLFSLMNYYSYVGFIPGYETQIAKRDFRVQLFFTIATLPIVAWLVTVNLVETLGVPIVTPTTTGAYPGSDVIAGLFGGSDGAAGLFGAVASVTSLSCPCTQQAVPLKRLATWTAPEDSFCAVLRASTNFSDTRSSEFLNLLTDDANAKCSADRAGLRAQLAQIASTSGLVANDANFQANVDELAFQMELALCDLAFGLAPPSFFFPNGVPPRVTGLENVCHTPQNTERLFLGPSAFSFSNTEANAVQLTQTRLLFFLNEALATCEALHLVREGFLRSVQRESFVALQALSVSNLKSAVERQWRQALAAASSPTASFVPGFSRQEPLAIHTEVFNSLETLGFVSDNFQLVPAAAIPLDSFPVSSRLPFARTDSIIGGTTQFYMMAHSLPTAQPRSQANVLVPIIAGEARTVVSTNLSGAGRFPAFQAQRMFRHVTSGLDSSDDFEGWVPIGDDILTLLDACASGLNISVDVHNLRGLRISDPEFENLQNPALYSPFVNSLNLSNTCSIGFPSTPFQLPPERSLPQGVLFNAPLRCPPLLVWLGQLRAASTYFNSTSNNRLTFDEVDRIFNNFVDPAERDAAILQRLDQGDLNDRVAVLSELMIARGGISFNVNTTAHYEACAPATCSYTKIEPPTVQRIVNLALANYGGTATSIIMVFGSLTLYSSFFMYQYKLWRARRREADELRSASKMASVLVTNPAGLR